MENTDKDHVAIDITILIMSSDEIQGDQKASMTNCMESDALPKTYTKPKLVPGFYSTKFNFSCTTEGKIGDTRYKNLGLTQVEYKVKVGQYGYGVATEGDLNMETISCVRIRHNLCMEKLQNYINLGLRSKRNITKRNPRKTMQRCVDIVLFINLMLFKNESRTTIYSANLFAIESIRCKHARVATTYICQTRPNVI